MRATILYGNTFPEATEQVKAFASLDHAVAWIRRNHKSIWKINDLVTFTEMPNHFDIIRALGKR